MFSFVSGSCRHGAVPKFNPLRFATDRVADKTLSRSTGRQFSPSDRLSIRLACRDVDFRIFLCSDIHRIGFSLTIPEMPLFLLYLSA